MLGMFWGKRAGRGSDRPGREDRRRGHAARRGHRPTLEGLEARIALSMDVWTGLAGDGQWMTANNWSPVAVPSPGDELQFPSTASGATNNNFSGGTTFASITIDGPNYDLTGNTLNLTTGFTADYSGTLTITMDTVLMDSNTPIMVSAGTTLAIAGVLSDTTTTPVNIDISGGGTLDLQGLNKYTGVTTVEAGTTLLVDGTTADVQDNDGVLGGNGSVGNVTSVGGVINPGHSSTGATAPGTLTANGSVTLDSGSTFIALLDGKTPGNGLTGYGQLVASRTTAGSVVTLGGATLDATLGPDYTNPAVGDQLTIIKNSTGSPISGIFAGLAEGVPTPSPARCSASATSARTVAATTWS